VTPEVATYLEMARTHLADARTVAALPLPHLAAREAYLAGYHAAEALVFARTGQAVKTHRGLRARFSELVRNDQRVDPGFLRFLARAYELKSIADYGGPPGIRITAAEATEAIDLADRLLTCVATIVADETTG
jgi:uncharacterized protein (UPF0332 family)